MVRSLLIRRIARALKPAGRCLLEVYNREFALAHGAERVLFHDEAVDRFVRPGAEPGALSMRLYSHDEWEQMLAANGLRIVATDGWKWPDDPPPPPWRADLVVARKDGR